MPLPARPRRRMWAISIAICLALCLPLGVAGWQIDTWWVHNTNEYARYRFSDAWLTAFAGCNSPRDAIQTNTSGIASSWVTRTFDDGSWIVIRSHSAEDDGRDWHRSVLLDSQHRLYVTDYDFHGQDGLHSAIDHIRAASLDDFHRLDDTYGWKPPSTSDL